MAQAHNDHTLQLGEEERMPHADRLARKLPCSEMAEDAHCRGLELLRLQIAEAKACRYWKLPMLEFVGGCPLPRFKTADVGICGRFHIAKI